MVISALVLLPLAAGLGNFLLRKNGLRRSLLIATAVSHLGLVVCAWMRRPAAILGGWLSFDELGLFFLTITSVLFLFSCLYGIDYLARESEGKKEQTQENLLFTNAPEARFVGCLLFFLAAMTLVTASQHFGILWVAIEATTLASAPLIYFHRHRRSLEATWKYLLVCSVGIAIALLGNFFLAVAASAGSAKPVELLVSDLMTAAARLDRVWLKAAFVCFLVGYGTKMGLAPMHTWLPDAHSESPSMVSALLSGALLNCAFLGILRIHGLCVVSGEALFSQNLLVGFGLLSMLVASIFIIGQTDYKRLLAYSSVEHMGILVLGTGLGSGALFGAMLHVLNHSLTKGTLFLVSGNILRVYKTKLIADVRGVIRVLPFSGVLWIAGLFAIAGSPPFGLFISELLILKGALDTGRFFTAGAYLFFLSLIFIGLTKAMLPMTQGRPVGDRQPFLTKAVFLSVVPALILMAGTLFLGLWIPAPVKEMLMRVSKIAGGFYAGR